MTPVTAFWHVANFFAPAFGIGTVAAVLTKALWPGSLSGVSWWRLARAAIGCCALVSTTGLVLLGRDGRTATYGAMMLACALTLWWIGFAQRRR